LEKFLKDRNFVRIFVFFSEKILNTVFVKKKFCKYQFFRRIFYEKNYEKIRFMWGPNVIKLFTSVIYK
jgi:hypothetical protein